MTTNTSTQPAPETLPILLVGGCGYIGSFLYQKLLADRFPVTVCDQLLRGNPLSAGVIVRDFSELDEAFLAPFAAVLWFGGHSSVDRAIKDPHGALLNNCLNLFQFAKRLSPHTTLIYASSASLYSTKGASVVPSVEGNPTAIPAQNAYDISKFAFDYLAEHFLGNFYGLRMGTVSGFSPNLRPELVFNAMNLAAVRTGRVHLKNGQSYRTILFLEDLWCLIRQLLLTAKPVQGAFVNAGSASFTMEALAQAIAAVWSAEVVYEGESETYSFLLDTAKMHAICGNQWVDAIFAQRCRDFIDACVRAKIVDNSVHSLPR